jgi:hypothetical protein
MSSIREELEHFDKVALWAYVISRAQNDQQNILLIVEGGNA